MHLVCCSLLAVLLISTNVNADVHHAILEAFVKAEMETMITVMKPMETMPDTQLNMVLMIMDLLRNSWKDKKGTRKIFEEIFSAVKPEDRVKEIKKVNMTIELMTWMHERLEEASPKVRMVIDKINDTFYSKKFVKASAEEKLKMTLAVITSIKYTKEDADELQKLSLEIKAKYHELGFNENGLPMMV